MRIGVIVDNMRVAQWQANALETIAGDSTFVVYNCETSPPARRRMSHALYYLLNMATVRNPLTRSVELPRSMRVERTRSFQATDGGLWQSLPHDVLDCIAADDVGVIVKFGMGLLRVPPPEQLNVPILSYHHGDPKRFRGRPAGFYEILQGERTVGQVVQRLSNNLDSGEIVAAAETRVTPHSYRATLMDAYRASPMLLRRAIENVRAGQQVGESEKGRVYRLPRNPTVLRFVAGRVGSLLRRLAYGATVEKRWEVATATLAGELSLDQIIEALGDERRWTCVPAPAGSRFLADPFFGPSGELLVECLSSRSGRGEIIEVDDHSNRRLSQGEGHFSYPAVLSAGERTWVVPEVASWSPPVAYPLAGAEFGEHIELQIPGSPRLLDPTPLQRPEGVFLFANVAGEGPFVLRLWTADAIDAQFAEHPCSPIRLSPAGGRMAGIPFVSGGKLIRVGQEFRREYGDGLCFFEVTKLSRKEYAERMVREFRFSSRRGPHTLNVRNGKIAFDSYREVRTAAAGWRRLRERLSRQRKQRSG